MTAARLSEPAIGYRVWLVADNELCALDANAWPIGDATARCRTAPDHAAPDAECGCGLYALHRVPARVPSGYVLGAIVAWGSLEVHADGFRAQHARPIALARDGSLRAQDVKALAARYQVPLVERSALTTVASEFGAAVPPEMWPTPDLHLARCLATALIRRERCWEPHDILGYGHDQFLSRVLARLEDHNESVHLGALLRDAWCSGDDQAARHPGRALATLRAVLQETLTPLADIPQAQTLEVLKALDCAHGPVRQTLVEMTQQSGAAAVPDSYLLRPEFVDAVGAEALERARTKLTEDGRLLPWGGGEALLALEPSLSDAEVERHILRVRLSYHVDQLLIQARERRPQLAHFVLEHGNTFGARVATEQLGPHARPALRRLLRRDPWGAHMWTVAMRNLVGPTEMRLAAERAMKHATDANGVIAALSMLPGDEARDGLRSLIRRISRLHPSAGNNPQARAWNAICTSSQLIALLDDEAVTAALHDQGLATSNHVRLLRAHPDADHLVAQRLWHHADLSAMCALHVLRATGPARLHLSKEALACAEQARADGRRATRLAAALAAEADRGAPPTIAAAIAADPDLPATVRAIAAHISGIEPSKTDVVMQRYHAWSQTQAADPMRDLLTGAWQHRLTR